MFRAQIIVAAIASTAVFAAALEDAWAHRIDAHISRSGLDFLAAQAPAFVPERLEPPEMSRRFLCVELIQRDTVVDLELHDLALEIPRGGVLRLELELSVEAEGELFLNNLYSCFGQETCRDRLSLSHARAVVEFQIEVISGKPALTVHDVRLLVEPEDIEIQLSDCNIDGMFNTVVGWTQSLALDFVLGMVGDAAAGELAPMLEEMLAGFMTFEGTFGPA
jgi:hypothetical protein